MDYMTMGNSGLKVSRACLGAMNFGKRTSEVDSRAILARALELGVVHIDTANAYGEGISEKIVGNAIRAVRDHPAVGRPGRILVVALVLGQPNNLPRASVHREHVEVQLLSLAGDEEHRHVLPPGVANFEIDVRPHVAQIGQHEAGRPDASGAGPR